MTNLVLDARNVRVYRDHLAAVRGVDLAIQAGQRVGLVGESGSGKSMTALGLMGLLPAGWSASGEALHDGVDLLSQTDKQLSKRRGRTMSMVFQDPMSALNPTKRVGRQVTEVIQRHSQASRVEAKARALSLFMEMQLPRPEQLFKSYPHQLSGGQRQRVMIAIALACSPSLIIADEPTTALDVTVQKDVLKLLDARVADHGSALLLITHALPVVAAMCEVVGVMYGGTIVEYGPVSTVFAHPRHPYTAALLKSQPTLDNYDFSVDSRLPYIPGSVPPLGEMPSGCPFRNRCERVTDVCAERPQLERRDADSSVACWHPMDERLT
ncbi:ABC transporter ATP-binding protein [Tessaracoccus sp.]